VLLPSISFFALKGQVTSQQTLCLLYSKHSRNYFQVGTWYLNDKLKEKNALIYQHYFAFYVRYKGYDEAQPEYNLKCTYR
jgi:hypothetical protein